MGTTCHHIIGVVPEIRDLYRGIYRLRLIGVPNSQSSPNHSLWLWVPDQRSASLRLSGTTAEAECVMRVYCYRPAFHAAVTSPILAISGSLIADGVRENRGAGAGCVTPCRSTNTLRAAMCG